MLMRLKPLNRDERGVALIVSLLIVFVVLLLAGVVFAQAVHNSNRSANDRKRLQSVDSAEAGLNSFYNYLENTAAVDLTANPVTGAIAVSPGTSSYTVTPTWYADAEGQVPFSGTFSDTNYPKSVRIVSQGTTNANTPRTMESFMAIHPVFGGFEGAVITTVSTSFTNNFTINGLNGNDGDIIVNDGSLTVPSGLANIHGSLYVPNGSVDINSNIHVYGSVWANGSATVNHDPAWVDGDLVSSTDAVNVPLGTVGGQGIYCTTVSGTSNIAGGTIQKCQGPPPSLAFPIVNYVDQTPNTVADPNWNTAGNTWVVATFSGATACSLAKTYVQGSGAGTFNSGLGLASGVTGVIVRIQSSCNFSIDNNKTVSLNSNLAIITDGSINLSQRSNWNGVGSTRNLFFVVPYRVTTPPDCNAASPALYDINFGNNTNFNALVNVGVYTPGRSIMNNQNAFNGQVIANQVCIGNNWSMNYKPVVYPGQHVTAFTEDIAFIREIPNS
jgi:hypothetical protein